MLKWPQSDNQVLTNPDRIDMAHFWAVSFDTGSESQCGYSSMSWGQKEAQGEHDQKGPACCTVGSKATIVGNSGIVQAYL